MSVTIQGTDELMKNLRKMLTGFKDDEVRKMMRGGADIIIQAAKARVKINDNNRLRDSIKVLPKFRGDPSGTYVGPKIIRRFTAKTSQKAKDNNPFYAHFIEYGTDAHDLGYKGKFVSDNSGKRGQHPGSRKFPYMRPAYDENRNTAINKMMDDVEQRIMSR